MCFKLNRIDYHEVNKVMRFQPVTLFGTEAQCLGLYLSLHQGLGFCSK